MQWVYIKVTKNGAPDVEKIDSRAHATELFYPDAAFYLGIAEESWPEIEWRVEAARTANYIIKGASKPQQRNGMVR